MNAKEACALKNGDLVAFRGEELVRHFRVKNKSYTMCDLVVVKTDSKYEYIGYTYVQISLFDKNLILLCYSAGHRLTKIFK